MKKGYPPKQRELKFDNFLGSMHVVCESEDEMRDVLDFYVNLGYNEAIQGLSAETSPEYLKNIIQMQKRKTIMSALT